MAPTRWDFIKDRARDDLPSDAAGGLLQVACVVCKSPASWSLPSVFYLPKDTMNFALLGLDAESSLLAHAAAGSPRHRLVAVCDLPPRHGPLPPAAPGAQIRSDWESLIDDPQVEAILVASGSGDEHADRLRALVRAGRPLVVSHPVHDSPLLMYELAMVAEESQAVLVPFLPLVWHAAFQRMASLADVWKSTAEGGLEQVVIERAMVDHSRDVVLRTFAGDALAAWRLLGELNRVGAMSPSGNGRDWANLGVQLSGPGGVLVRWSTGPVEDDCGGRITLFAGAHKAVLSWPGGGNRPWTLSQTEAGRTEEEHIDSPELAARVLDHVGGASDAASHAATWIEACHSVDLADAVERSLRRGRTVELHFDEAEQGAFKGVMTTLGCFVLVGVAGIFVLMTIAAGIGLPGVELLPWLALGMLVLFLLLQLLRWIVPEADEHARQNDQHARQK